MRLPAPRSLGGQTLAVLFAGLVVSHFIGIAIYSLDRREAAETDDALDVAERAVGVLALLLSLPEEWRSDVLRGFDSRTFGVSRGEAPLVAGDGRDEALAEEVRTFLAEQLPGVRGDGIRVRFAAARARPGDSAAAPAVETGWLGDAVCRLLGGSAHDRLQLSIQLEEGRWLNFNAAMPRKDRLWPGLAAAYILSVALGVGALMTWLVARVTAPLSNFARAADRFGRNLRAEPLPERGPSEVVQASRALNEMQERLRRLVENRTQMLAAISHDLRTPVTLLRLRAELMAEGEDRAKVLATLDEMEAMIGSVLTFARETFHDEPQRQVDLSALVASICDDMADAGAAVDFDPPDQVAVTCRRTALKRALTNLIENAVTYGGVAHVTICRSGGTAEIVIDDEGPGIPEDQLERVFMPFYRLDHSRSRGRGGVGLGLSIAQAIVHGHGGTLRAGNRPEGGLRVRVTLPR